MTDIYTPEGFYSTTLSADINASTATIPLTVVPTRQTKGYMVIEPTHANKREVVHFTSVGASSVTVADDTTDAGDATGRGCVGSVTVGANTSHAQGVTVWIASTENYFKRIVGMLDGTYSTVTLLSPALTTPKIVTSINDANGNEVIKIPATTSAVNEFTDTNAATGNAPERSVTGDNTNIDHKVKGKGTGQFKAYDPYITDYVPVTDGLRYDSLSRQAIINGNFDVWQRGTSVAWGNGVYTADRWLFVTGSGQTGTITQQDGTGVAGSQYSMRVQRTAGQLASNNEVYYAMESRDSIKLRGKKLTLSFWAKCGANFSPTSSLLPVAIVTGKGTDQKVASFTTTADAIAENKTLTTSWQLFTITTTAVIASDITQIGLRFSNYTTGTASTNDWFEITQVQLCAGDVALPFQPKSEAQEELDCWRYAFKAGSDTSGYSSIASGNCTATTSASALIVFPVRMRTAPTSTYPTANTLGVIAAAGTVVALTVIADDVLTDYSARVTCTTASGLTAGNATNLIKNNSTSTILFSAEL